jgi:hypothetical protein
VWELASGSVLARFPGAGAIGEVTFSADSRRIALVDARGVQVHDLPSGKRVATYEAVDVACEPTGFRGSHNQPLAFAPDGSTLATGHRDGSITIWKVPTPPSSPRVSRTENNTLWADLGSPNAQVGRAAVERFLGDPLSAIALPKARFVPPAAPRDVAALIDQLDAEGFAEREAASRKLGELGWRASGALRRAAQTAKSLEVRRRAEAILRGIAPLEASRPLSGAALRGVRAIEVLERLGNDESRKLLRGWAEQTSDRDLAAEALTALSR